MQIQVDIGFDDLIKMVKKLPRDQFARLRKELDKIDSKENKTSDLESFLLQAPTFSEQQLEAIASTGKAINEWRKN